MRHALVLLLVLRSSMKQWPRELTSHRVQCMSSSAGLRESTCGLCVRAESDAAAGGGRGNAGARHGAHRPHDRPHAGPSRAAHLCWRRRRELSHLLIVSVVHSQLGALWGTIHSGWLHAHIGCAHMDVYPADGQPRVATARSAGATPRCPRCCPSSGSWRRGESNRREMPLQGCRSTCGWFGPCATRPSSPSSTRRCWPRQGELRRSKSRQRRTHMQ